MEKKTRYITFSICESDYMKIKEKADKDRRPLAQFIALLVVDYLEGKK